VSILRDPSRDKWPYWAYITATRDLEFEVTGLSLGD